MPRGLAALFAVALAALSTAPVVAQQAPEPAAPTSPPDAQASPAGAQAVPAPAAPAAAAPPSAPSPVWPAAPGTYQPQPTAVAAPPARVAQGREYDGPPTLFGRRKIHVGGYGGVGAAYTRMLGRDGALMSFEGALLLAHRLSLGVAGYGFSRTPDGPAAADGTARELGAGYGGFVGRYALFADFPVYASLGLLVGGGAVVLHREDDGYDGRDEDWDDDDDWDEDEGDGFFVVQPELSLHANVTRWMRFGLTGGYRFTSGVSRFGVKESELNGVVLGGNVQFGWI